MRRRSSTSSRARWTSPLVVLACCFACACASGSPGVHLQIHDQGGFTITEDVQLGDQAQADFETALGLLERGDYTRAIPLLEDVVLTAPSATAAFIDLGIAYGRIDDLEGAKAAFDRALELNPRHPVTHNELGILNRRIGQFDEARDSYERALEIYPGFHYARRNLAILCDVYLDDPECALREYEIYQEAVPEDEAPALWIADLRNRLNEEEEP